MSETSSHPDVERVLHALAREVGGAPVARALPQAGCRAVGPFVFLDHFGPEDVAPGVSTDVRPHPHIGLSTVTYLFEGEIVHRDSLGVVQTIEPGEINVMTSGAGIVHSERASPERRQRGGRTHGLQFWVALPAANEDDAPSFEHHGAGAFPEINVSNVSDVSDVSDASDVSEETGASAGPGVRGRVLLGESYGARSPGARERGDPPRRARTPAARRLLLAQPARHRVELRRDDPRPHRGGEGPLAVAGLPHHPRRRRRTYPPARRGEPIMITWEREAQGGGESRKP